MSVCVCVCGCNVRCPKTSLGWLIPDAGRKGRWENGFWGTADEDLGRCFLRLSMDYKAYKFSFLFLNL